ncbi:MAG: hypothetical protein H7Y42_03285 [Chitinophagaceae bacterium]|nr:hypothetical protein [Chitinophagaceae bacterium]
MNSFSKYLFAVLVTALLGVSTVNSQQVYKINDSKTNNMKLSGTSTRTNGR